MAQSNDLIDKDKIALELCDHLGCRTNAFKDFRFSKFYFLIVDRCIKGENPKAIAEWLKNSDEVFQEQKLESIIRKVGRLKNFLAERGKLTGYAASTVDYIAQRLNYYSENILIEKEKVLAVQKWRLEKALIEESESKHILRSTSECMITYNKMLNDMIDLRVQLGLIIDTDTPRKVLPNAESPVTWLKWMLKHKLLNDKAIQVIKDAIEMTKNIREQLETESDKRKEKLSPFLNRQKEESH